MQQRIPVSDPRLAARIERVVDDLEKYYPDHLVSRVATDHKRLDERITGVYRDAGYESRAAFYEAYGFKTDTAKMGRPTSLDVEGLMSKLEARYENAPKPAKLGDLKTQNPDLAGELKTFANNVKALTGKTAAVYLKERGILASPKSDGSPKPAGGEGSAAAAKPKARKASSSEPNVEDIKAAIDAMVGGDIKVVVSAKADGAVVRTADAHATDDGTNADADVTAFTSDVTCDEDALAAIDSLVRKLESATGGGIPCTLDALKERFPPYAKAIDYATRRGFGADRFASAGIIGDDRWKLWIRDDQYSTAGPVSIELDEYAAAGIPVRAVPDCADAKRLPPHVAGIDMKMRCELHEYTAFVQGAELAGVSEGSTLGIHRVPREFVKAPNSQESQTSDGVACVVQRIVELDGKPYIRLQKNDILAGEAPSSLLAPYEGAEVVATGQASGVPYAFVRVRAMRPMRRDTLIWLLRDAGIVNDADLRGGVGWRWRLMRHGGANPFEQASN